MPHYSRHVFVCTNVRPPESPKGCCAAKGADAVRAQFKKRLHELGLKQDMRANAAGCLDQCENGVTVVIYPEQVWYGHVTVDDVEEIVQSHLIGGHPVERLRLPSSTPAGRGVPGEPGLADTPSIRTDKKPR